MAKLFLELDEDYDFQLLGIHSSQEAYRLAFLINQGLNYKFVQRRKSWEVLSKGLKWSHLLFDFDDSARSGCQYVLIQNQSWNSHELQATGTLGLFDMEQSNRGFLIPEEKKVDYLLMVFGGSHPDYCQQLMEELKGVKQIQAIRVLTLDKLKSKSNLLHIIDDYE